MVEISKGVQSDEEIIKMLYGMGVERIGVEI
jgi:hypothetical protein